MPLLIPPPQFGMVDDDIYRSAEPIDVNFPFLDSLHLRCIVCLSPSPPSFALHSYVEDRNLSAPRTSPTLRLLHLSPSSLDPAPPPAPSHPSSSPSPPTNLFPSLSHPLPPALPTSLSEEAVITVLSLFLDPSSLPLLLCCPSGRHSTGAVVGCWRKTCGWSLSAVFAEYRRYAGGGGGGGGGGWNEQFIELFDTELVGGRRERERRRRRGVVVNGTGAAGGGGGIDRRDLSSLHNAG